MNYYAAAKAAYGPKAKDPSLRNKMLEAVCETGEVFYVPSGWWHLVVNLESSIAVTQNFVSPSNLPGVLHFLKHRSDQVSGFKLKQEAVVEAKSQEREYNGEEDDETGGGAVFARFCEVLGKQQPDVLLKGMEGLVKLEMVNAMRRRDGQNRKDKEGQTLWTSLIASKDDGACETSASPSGGGFSFGFDLGSDAGGEDV